MEGDDDTGGWQVRGIGQGWATEKRTGGSEVKGVRGEQCRHTQAARCFSIGTVL